MTGRRPAGTRSRAGLRNSGAGSRYVAISPTLHAVTRYYIVSDALPHEYALYSPDDTVASDHFC